MNILFSGKSPPKNGVNFKEVIENVGKNCAKFIIGTPVLGYIRDVDSANLFRVRFQDRCEADSKVTPFTFVFSDLDSFHQVAREFNRDAQPTPHFVQSSTQSA